MTKVGSGVAFTSIAGTLRVERPFVLLITGMLDNDAALGGKQVSIAGVARRQDAIHHVHSSCHVLGQFGWHSDPHRITWLGARKNPFRRLHRVKTQWTRFAYRETPD